MTLLNKKFFSSLIAISWLLARPLMAAQDVELAIRETAGIARSSEVVSNGIPLPASAKIYSTAELSLFDPAGIRIPAEFRILARWNSSLSDSSAPIQWVLITFAASVEANSNSIYKLRLSPGIPSVSPVTTRPLMISRSGDGVSVDTGSSVFSVGNTSAVFDQVKFESRVLAAGGSATGRFNNTDSVIANKSLSIERQGDLAAVLTVRGRWNLPPVGGGALSFERRYTFTAGSPAAIVRETLNWEGDLCPENGWDTACDSNRDGQNEPNAVLVENLKSSLLLNIGSPLSVSVFDQASSPSLSGSLSGPELARLEQVQRSSRLAPLSFLATLPGQSRSGGKADGAMVVAAGPSGSIGAAFNHIHRYEPQAVSLASGELILEPVSDHVWLGQRQGLYAEYAVAAGGASATSEDYRRLLWAPLNHPLRAWPAAEWFSSSGAVDPVPTGELPESYRSFDSVFRSVLRTTLEKVDEKGTAGLMTYGLYPRYWGTGYYGDEIDCAENDPTPYDDWDDTYWCGTWTDYHNTSYAAASYAMRSGEVQWLDEISFPAALRTLHTQIMQCSDSDTYSYCGQAPAGYGGYRTDFNSSHAYFENLFLYYWLTGDETVPRVIERGASQMRNYYCARRPLETCLPDDPPTDEFAGPTGRVAMQWAEAFRFTGLSSNASYLDDYASLLSRAVTQNYVEGHLDGKTYGFWLSKAHGPAGSYLTDQLWMATLYDMYLLRRYSVDTADFPFGFPLIAPSRVMTGWSRTLLDIGAKVLGDGTAAGIWPNELSLTIGGERLSARLSAITAANTGSDPFLYDTGKATLAWLLALEGRSSKDARMLALASGLVQRSLDASLQDGSPLGKVQGEYLSRLPQAVAILVSGDPVLVEPVATPAPSPTPQPGLSVMVQDASCSEHKKDAGAFLILRGQRSRGPLLVKYRLSGKAGNGKDYRRLSGVAKFSKSATGALVRIRPLDDGKKETPEKVRLTISSGKYRLGRPKAAEIWISDND